MSTFALRMNFHGGTRERFDGPGIMVSVANGRGKILTKDVFRDGDILDLPITNGIADQFTINASATGYRDAGLIGYRPPDGTAKGDLHLMLVGREAEPSFPPDQWPTDWSAPLFHRESLITAIENGELQKTSAACLLNILEATRALPGGAGLLAAITEINLAQGGEDSRGRRQTALLQDRALVRVRSSFRQLLIQAGKNTIGAAIKVAHGRPLPGEKVESFKEVRFPHANLQFTLFDPQNESDVYADLDMDYHRNALSHFMVEYLPNAILGARTHPGKIYALRWMVSKNGRPGPEFAPPYVFV
ncbi:MAG: hypothetical protein R2729_20770 [Bryobacteraceae bacterium]